VAVAANEIPVDRHHVTDWVEAWKQNHKGKTLEEYIRHEIKGLGLEDEIVDTTGHDSLENETHIADMIVMDQDSYIDPAEREKIEKRIATSRRRKRS
jgi:hypothetical protein